MNNFDPQEDVPVRKKRRVLRGLLWVLFFGILAGGGFWAARQILANGEILIIPPAILVEQGRAFLPVSGEWRWGPLHVDWREHLPPPAPPVRIDPVPVVPDPPLTVDLPPPPPPPPPALPEDPVPPPSSGLVSATPSEMEPPAEPQVSRGNVVGKPLKEDARRPRTGGIAVHPSRSAVTQVPAQVPAAREQDRRKVTTGEDGVVTLDFVQDLSAYLASSYWPRGTHVSAKDRENSTASVSALNQRYGLELAGFISSRVREGRRDYHRDRRLLLNYVFSPYMVPALTRMYSDRLADRLAEDAGRQIRSLGGQEYPLQTADVIAMLRYYAQYAQAVGLVFLAYAENGAASEAIYVQEKAAAVAFEADNHMQEARHRLNMAREEDNRENERTVSAALNTAEQTYRDALLALRRAKGQTAAAVSKGQTGILDNDSLAYIASWASRRGPNAGETLRAVSSAAEYLSQVLRQKADELAQKGTPR